MRDDDYQDDGFDLEAATEAANAEAERKAKFSKAGKARAASLSKERASEIGRKAARARWGEKRARIEGFTSIPNKADELSLKPLPQQTPHPYLHIVKLAEVDSVEMGVLSNGTSFLSAAGLAKLCGVGHPQIVELAAQWGMDTPRIAAIKGNFLKTISVPACPYVPIKHNGTIYHAFEDYVCLAVLEYYCYEGKGDKQHARSNFRGLAGKALRDYVYDKTGYDPNPPKQDHPMDGAWKMFGDRLSITHDSVPRGYFGIFKEMADMIYRLGHVGLHIDSKFVPDISVGSTWSRYWTENHLAQEYGERIKYLHNYPSYFPQAKSNPQDPWAYPLMAMGRFREWLQEVYIDGGKFSHYLHDKVLKNELPAEFAQKAIEAYSRPSAQPVPTNTRRSYYRR